MNENTLYIGLIISMLTILLGIIIYMIAPEQYMPEVCREHIDASTKICNGGFK